MVIHQIAASRNDLVMASLGLGFTFGFGFLTTWKAIRQTLKARQPIWKSTYLILVWGETIANICFAILSYLLITELIAPTITVIVWILILWSIQVQFLLQIIVNRVGVILGDFHKLRWLKIVTIGLWCVINISGFCIWLPAKIGVNETYSRINFIWNRTEKAIYLVVDAGLNWYFISLVKKRLVQQGMRKYERLVRFNTYIIFGSVAMDILLIALMNLKNENLYLQIHPLSYTVKLNIEMTMASLIRKISVEQISRSADLSSTRAGTGYDFTVVGGGDIPMGRLPQHSGDGVLVHMSVTVESHVLEEGSKTTETKKPS